MAKRIIPVLFALCAVAPSASAGTVEALRAASNASFQALSGYKDILPPPLKAAQAKPITHLKAASTRYVRISGQVSLSGTGYAPKGSNFVSVNLTGWTDIQDFSGRIRSGMSSVSYMGHFFINGNMVSDWVRPSLYVSLYRDSRYLGSARVDGSIHVSGYVSNGLVRVSGSGTLSGDIMVQDD